MPRPDQRVHALSLMSWTRDNAALAFYENSRPMYLPYETDLAEKIAKRETWKWDCSAGVSAIAKMAGFKDPSGNNFSGIGNSQEMLDNLPHYTNFKTALVGSLIVFGADLPVAQQHVVMVYSVSTSGNPMVWSHGSDAGPIVLTLQAEQSAHSGATVGLTVSSL